MKKNLVLIAFFLLTSSLAKANVTASLSLFQINPSANFPNTYNVILFAGSMTNSGCSGVFTFAFQRTQTPNISSSWVPIVATLITIPSPSPGDVSSGFYKIYQPDGTKYYYRLKVIFNPNSVLLNDPCTTNPNEYNTSVSTVMADVSMSACFTIPNYNSAQMVSSYYGNVPLNNICSSSGNIILNGSCSQNESGYHIRIAEFDLATWQIIEDYYDDWVGSGQAPSNVNLNNLIATNGKSFKSKKVYLVNLSVGPIWHSAQAQFFKIDTTCKYSEEEVEEIKHNQEANFLITPNPSSNFSTINFNESKVSNITIFNMEGKKIEAFYPSKDTNKYDIDITNYLKGIYLIHIKTEKEIIVRKLIKI